MKLIRLCPTFLFIAFESLTSRKKVLGLPCVSKSLDNLASALSKIEYFLLIRKRDFPFDKVISAIGQTDKLVAIGEYLLKLV